MENHFTNDFFKSQAASKLPLAPKSLGSELQKWLTGFPEPPSRPITSPPIVEASHTSDAPLMDEDDALMDAALMMIAEDNFKTSIKEAEEVTSAASARAASHSGESCLAVASTPRHIASPSEVGSPAASSPLAGSVASPDLAGRSAAGSPAAASPVDATSEPSSPELYCHDEEGFSAADEQFRDEAPGHRPARIDEAAPAQPDQTQHNGCPSHFNPVEGCDATQRDNAAPATPSEAPRPRTGLKCDAEWTNLILPDENGQMLKTWEIRSKTCKKRGLICLGKNGDLFMHGECEITDSFLTSKAQLLLNFGRHRIPRKRLHTKGKIWVWVLANAVKYVQPVPYQHKKGSQSWVKFQPFARPACENDPRRAPPGNAGGNGGEINGRENILDLEHAPLQVVMAASVGQVSTDSTPAVQPYGQTQRTFDCLYGSEVYSTQRKLGIHTFTQPKSSICGWNQKFHRTHIGFARIEWLKTLTTDDRRLHYNAFLAVMAGAAASNANDYLAGSECAACRSLLKLEVAKVQRFRESLLSLSSITSSGSVSHSHDQSPAISGLTCRLIEYWQKQVRVKDTMSPAAAAAAAAAEAAVQAAAAAAKEAAEEAAAEEAAAPEVAAQEAPEVDAQEAPEVAAQEAPEVAAQEAPAVVAAAAEVGQPLHVFLAEQRMIPANGGTFKPQYTKHPNQMLDASPSKKVKVSKKKSLLSVAAPPCQRPLPKVKLL